MSVDRTTGCMVRIRCNFCLVGLKDHILEQGAVTLITIIGHIVAVHIDRSAMVIALGPSVFQGQVLDLEGSVQ